MNLRWLGFKPKPKTVVDSGLSEVERLADVILKAIDLQKTKLNVGGTGQDFKTVVMDVGLRARFEAIESGFTNLTARVERIEKAQRASDKILTQLAETTVRR